MGGSRPTTPWAVSDHVIVIANNKIFCIKSEARRGEGEGGI